ncbi:MAG: hypothetical protein ACKOX3_08890 [Bacteroidota bacterium]
MDDQQLDKYRNDLEFIRLTAEQFIRDCERIGFQVEMNVLHLTGILHLQMSIEPYIKQWCKEENARLAALLYQIDVPEHLLPERGPCSDISGLTAIVVKRELIKVVLRKLYSK